MVDVSVHFFFYFFKNLSHYGVELGVDRSEWRHPVDYFGNIMWINIKRKNFLTLEWVVGL